MNRKVVESREGAAARAAVVEALAELLLADLDLEDRHLESEPGGAVSEPGR